MVIHRDRRRADTREVLDEFETWLLRERSAQVRTAAAYTARVTGFAEWLAAPIDRSLGTLTAATVIKWVNLEAARGLKSSTLGKQMVMLRSFLQFCQPLGPDGAGPLRCGAARGRVAAVLGPRPGPGRDD